GLLKKHPATICVAGCDAAARLGCGHSSWKDTLLCGVGLTHATAHAATCATALLAGSGCAATTFTAIFVAGGECHGGGTQNQCQEDCGDLSTHCLLLSSAVIVPRSSVAWQAGSLIPTALNSIRFHPRIDELRGAPS